ncbi:bifunctional diguanylate cyclase/phosphodiesterase [Thalassotalea atypica]|uniref:bifunctional diguanylate cyclase/phosphodiesterase n=1 Tax=Thalassotalea atypica TaxID=2054316 RepID=UPI00257431F4|nr:bifunctional diguanylate cyclase/phosphodiesterase [Thalassotalea atypica]
MRKKFVSVPVKLLCLIVGSLLLLSAGFTSLSIWRLQDEFVQHQQDKLSLGKAQFAIEQEALNSQLRIWVESFSDIVGIAEHDDFSVLSEAMKQQFYALQLHLNVENFWLVDENFQTLASTEHSTPALVRDNVAQVFTRQEPLGFVSCDNNQRECLQIISVPILNKNGQVAVISMSATLVEVLFTLNQTLNSEVAVVKFPLKTSLGLQEAEIISASNKQLTEQIFKDFQESLYTEKLGREGVELEGKDNHYLINFIPLSNTEQSLHYLLLIDDVIDFKEKNIKYRNYFLVTESVIFLVLAMFVFFITGPFTKRLLNLANALPLLARKEFNKFRAIDLQRKGFFRDELDVLTKSAQELSFELEQLNIEVEQKTKELENIAMYDILTGLPNRNMLNHQLRKSLANMPRTGQGIAILFLDLDDFKKVNDSHGHAQGDKLLEEAARRIRTSISKVDLVCRFGGDEFVIILNQVPNVDEVVLVAEDVLQRFKTPIKVGSGIFYVSTSVGIVYTDDPLSRVDDLISFADIAMYEAKNRGGSQYYIYHTDMYLRVAQRVALESEVRQALLKRQFSLSLQPQLEAKTKRLCGFEALLRWEHPERGMVPPDDFIPILENSEYMIELGYWVIRRCFEIVTELKSHFTEEVRIAINLSAAQFLDPDLPDYLSQMMDRFSLPARYFELELTEQTLVSDIDTVISVMRRLKLMGFSFAIDDFGTGYSSLAYLKKMPVDVIKIDKSFIFGMLENHSDYQIIMSTIAMVKNLGLQVTAEGVESSAQLRSLTENDCDVIQGYYFSKPIPDKEISKFIEEQLVDGYWKTQVNK